MHNKNIKDSTNVNKIEFLSSAFPVDLNIGSDFSNELLLKMANTQNNEIFRSNIILFLDYKWYMLRKKVYAYQFLYFVNLMLITTYITMFYLNRTFTAVLLALSVLLSILEIPQLYQSIIHFINGESVYNDIMNVF